MRDLAPGIVAAISDIRDQAGVKRGHHADHAAMLEAQAEARRAVNDAMWNAADEREQYAARRPRKHSRRKRIGST